MTPIFTIEHKNDLYHVVSVDLDALAPNDPSTGSGCTLDPAYIYLRGEYARRLYLALTGHEFGAPPCTASLMLARMVRCDLAWFKPARRYPEPLREWVEGYNLAAAVVRDWGGGDTAGVGVLGCEE